MALSETSSSSSSDSKTGLCSAARPMATSSLNEVCFLLLGPPKEPWDFFRLSERELLYMWLSRELSSSPEEVPMVNMAPPRFFGGSRAEGEGFFKMGVGCARFVCERYDEGAPPILNPRTTLWLSALLWLSMLTSVLELPSEPTVWDAASSSWVPTVDADDSSSVEREAEMDVGWEELGCGVESLEKEEEDASACWDRMGRVESWMEGADAAGGSCAGRDVDVDVDADRGRRSSATSWMSGVSWMMAMIFSSALPVMCRSLGLPDGVHSARFSSGRALGIARAHLPVDAVSTNSSTSSSDDSESRLDDSAGTAMSRVAACVSCVKEHRSCGANEDVDDDADRACLALQQKVSRFHNRQLMFSYRFPWSMACEVLENNDHCARKCE